ncbi:MAG: arginase family protein, partial [Bacteroidota bacterium]
MLIYFPQWQGSSTGQKMKTGAEVLIKYLNRPFTEVALSNKALITEYQINGYQAIFEQLSDFRANLKQRNPTSMRIVGGDCGLEIIPVSFLASKYENIGVIWFDAHADFNIPEESPSGNFHGMPLRTLIGEGDEKMKSLLFKQISPSKIHYLGLRSVDQAEKIALKKYGVFSEFKPSIDKLVQTLKTKGIKNLYIHFDVDCLDPEAFCYSYYQVANGLTVEDSISYLEALKA